MRLFLSKEEKELDAILAKVDNNMSNNYKDAAQEDYKKFLKRFAELTEGGKLKEKSIAYYQEIISEYAAKLSKFTHKDQPTKWGDWEKK
ncbi:MAG: hypothetical protein K5879_08455 [Lachnospiraceae bacterium]|nr:hypothetical protein [Lachnospiraceae bacterium]